MLPKERQMRLFAVLLIPAVALIMGASVTRVWADDPECFFNIEFNATDLDVGVRGFFDYEPWTDLEIFGPAILAPNRKLADVQALNNLELQGFAEWFFESGEPTLFEVPFSTFLPRFPERYYDFDSNPLGNFQGAEDCQAELTHLIPCAPEISASGNRGLGVTISWEGVTQVVDTAETDTNVSGADPEDFDAEELLECEDSVDLEIIGYKVIVEIEFDDEVVKIFDVDLLEDDRSVHVPAEFIALSDEFKYEVLAIEASGNQTITEDEFCVNEINGQVEECEEEDGE